MVNFFIILCSFIFLFTCIIVRCKEEKQERKSAKDNVLQIQIDNDVDIEIDANSLVDYNDVEAVEDSEDIVNIKEGQNLFKNKEDNTQLLKDKLKKTQTLRTFVKTYEDTGLSESDILRMLWTIETNPLLQSTAWRTRQRMSAERDVAYKVWSNIIIN